MNQVTFEERWNWLISYMVVTNKFVHYTLRMMDKVRDDSINIMGVRVEPLKITLLYNEEQLSKMDDKEIRFIIMHEVLHVVLHHCTVRDAPSPDEAQIYNYAQDLAVNSMVLSIIPVCDKKRKYFEIPHTEDGEVIGLLPEKFGYPDNLSSNQYLELLRKDQKEKKPDIILLLADENGSNRLDDHSQWGESNIMDEVIRDKMKKALFLDKVWGDLSGGAQSLITQAQINKISWERYLKYHIGNLIAPTYTRTITKPDKRYGYPYLGKKRGYRDKKLVAIDTSGSISDKDLSKFLCAINKLVEIMSVDLVLFDSKIQIGPVSFHRKHISYDFKGRGGTDFQPVFNIAVERKYQSVILLTDGCACSVEYPKGVKDVLWVLTDKSMNPPVDWGERVHIDE